MMGIVLGLMIAVWMAVATAGEVKAESAIVLASDVGAALDSDLMKGGGTDDTDVLQHVLDRAKDGRAVHLIIDGPTLIGGLDIYGNSTIECTAGGGLYLKEDANRAILRNAHRSRGVVTEKHIAIRGCFLNGNRERQRIGASLWHGRYTPYEPDGKTFQSGLQFFGVEYLTLENLTLWNIRSFGVWIANAKFVQLGNIIVDTGLPPYPDGASLAEQQHYMTRGVNDDGVHFTGPIQYLTVDGLKLRTLDDALALNANEGPITDVAIRNVVFMDAHQGIRLLSRNQRIDRIVIENITGTVRQRVVLLSPYVKTDPDHTGDFGSIIISNVAVDPVESPPYLELYPFIKEWVSESQLKWDVAEEAKRPLFSLNSPIESLGLHHVAAKVIDRRPLIRVGPDAAIQTLNVDLSIHDPEAQAVPLRLMGRIERLNFSLDWKGETAIQYEGGTIGRLRWGGTAVAQENAQ